MKNPYKRHDIFKCSQEAHQRFQGRVSAYHVLKEKHCYPMGCIYFLWHCTKLEKGKRCIRGFQYAGRQCHGCMHFMDEKVHLQPELIVTAEQYEDFLEEAEMFDAWLESVRFRRLSIAGRISVVKPWFEKRILSKETHTKLMGFLLVFRKGFLGITRFDDTFYIRVSAGMMKMHLFRPGMRMELTGEIREDRGRVLVHAPKQIECMNRGWGRLWTRQDALVAVKTATLMEEQPEQCLGCPWGALTDVHDFRNTERQRYRHLYCLKGIQDPDGCYVRVQRKLRKRKSSMKNGQA